MSAYELADLPSQSDDSRYPHPLMPADAAVFGEQQPIGAAPPPLKADTSAAGTRVGKGRAFINAARLRQLRESRLLSQQDLADDCFRRRLQVSIATIKRAETGHAVRYRIVRELARYFEVPFDTLL